MQAPEYSKKLGILSPGQFQAALDRFDLGTFVRAEAVPFGLFGQNVFLTSTQGEYVLRGSPHFPWQFPTEQFFARQLHERTKVPVPWPYLIDPSTEIFGWSYVIMPLMPGVQLANPEVKAQLTMEDKRGIARAMGMNLAEMQVLTWPFIGRYDVDTDTVQPFVLEQELAYPFPVKDEGKSATVRSAQLTYGEVVVARIRHLIAGVVEYSSHTTASDVQWVETLLASAQDALDDSFQPCIVLEDYKEHNAVVECVDSTWRVSGVFDLMTAHFGDGEADLSRTTGMYLYEDPMLAREFVQAYVRRRPPRPGFAARFPIYMLLDRLIIWDYVERNEPNWQGAKLVSFQEWASRYTSSFAELHL